VCLSVCCSFLKPVAKTVINNGINQQRKAGSSPQLMPKDGESSLSLVVEVEFEQEKL
jgi:hypothetical protein